MRLAKASKVWASKSNRLAMGWSPLRKQSCGESSTRPVSLKFPWRCAAGRIRFCDIAFISSGRIVRLRVILLLQLRGQVRLLRGGSANEPADHHFLPSLFPPADRLRGLGVSEVVFRVVE